MVLLWCQCRCLLAGDNYYAANSIQPNDPQNQRMTKCIDELRGRLKCWYKNNVGFYVDQFSHINICNAEKEECRPGSEEVIFTGFAFVIALTILHTEPLPLSNIFHPESTLSIFPLAA
jgi:hypothetical protein